MSRKKMTLKYKKERSVLSDVLPYEVPITFTNRQFYDFLLSHKIRYHDNKIEWLAGDAVVDCIICLLFCIPKSPKPTIETKTLFDKERGFNQLSVENNKWGAIPFAYKISHKQNEYRELAIPHPRNQLQVIEFYDRYKELILYYCSISSFSIRHPKKVSKYIFYKDSTHDENLSDDSSSKEEVGKEYENLRSFFVYKDYSNVYKFYESDKYHQCEKKYNKLLKLDISKCFDSIYTHSLAWALLNKESVKNSLDESKTTFAGHFDGLMQQINYNETNGIIIGPEFSRIFAELILQSVDRIVEQKLVSKHNLKHKVDYEIFRYVDDYFIFFNEDSTKDKITEILQIALKAHKLYLNTAKSIIYEKPIITEISIAKIRIVSLLVNKLIYKLEDGQSDNQDEQVKKGSIHINSRTFITQFKTIIKECRVEYKDILNYSFSIIEKQCHKIIKNYYEASEDHRSEKQLIEAILGILEFVFFIYSASPRVNTTIKLCQILQIFINSLKAKDINEDFKHLVFKYIYDDIYFILKKNKYSEYIQVETLYLLIALSELGEDYWLEESLLFEYFNIKEIDADDVIKGLNYFSITVVLFYIKKEQRYNKLRESIENVIIKKLESKKAAYVKSELTMLLLDTISCPYVSKETKTKLLDLYDVDENLHNDILDLKHKQQVCFTTWNDFNFKKELDMKRGQEVY